MGGDPFLFGLDRFFRGRMTGVCVCGHASNIINSGERTCSERCGCPLCPEMTIRQPMVIEDD